MKKSKIYVVFVVCFCIMLVLTLVSCNNNAAEEVVAEANQKTDIASWFEEHLGWFVGIPTGMLITTGIDILGLLKKRKAYTKDLFENSVMREAISKKISELSETNVKFGKFVTDTQNKLIAADKKIDNVINKAEEQAKRFEELSNASVQVENKVDTLLKVLSLMASQNNELVTNGVAEQINKLVEGE